MKWTYYNAKPLGHLISNNDNETIIVRSQPLRRCANKYIDFLRVITPTFLLANTCTVMYLVIKYNIIPEMLIFTTSVVLRGTECGRLCAIYLTDTIKLIG